MNKFMSLVFSVLVIVIAIATFIMKDLSDTRLILILVLLAVSVLYDIKDEIHK